MVVRKVKKNQTGMRWWLVLLVMLGTAGLVCQACLTRGNQPSAQIDNAVKTPAAATDAQTPAAVDDSATRGLTPTLLPVPAFERATQAPAPTDVSATLPPLPPLTPSPAGADSLAELYSHNAILIRLEDQTILMQKNSDDQIYPASLSKIMTAIVAIENLPDLQAEIELTEAAFQGLYAADASVAGFQPGEQVRAIDLLYGLMLPSGAECALGLAEQIAGYEGNFVKLMNQKAAALGMDHTHFANTTGLHAANHYTTVKDLALLLSYALQNDTFREIFTSASYATSPTNLHSGGITFYSTMFQGLSLPALTEGEILGGKTGYTPEAGLCLASLARVGRQEYILITAGAAGDHYSEQFNLADAYAVYNRLGPEGFFGGP